MGALSGTEAWFAFLLALRARGTGHALLAAFETTPRPHFAPRRLADLALQDIALPIGCGQAMAAPSVLAAMMSALDARPGQRVLEVGTGSGFAAALLARLGAGIVTLERYRSLAVEARARLDALGVAGVRVLHADGHAGWPGGSPYDRILVHGAFDAPPPALLAQLAPGGRLIGVLSDRRGPSLARVSAGGAGASGVERLAPLALPALTPGRAAAL